MVSRDIGDAGPVEGRPVHFRWALWWTLGPLLGWIVLLPLMLLRENRRPAAWWIFAPVLLVQLLLAGLDRLGPGLDISRPGGGVAAALAALLLLAGRLPRRPAWRKAASAAAVWLFLSALALVWNGESASPARLLLDVLPAGVAGVVFLAAWALAARRYRRSPRAAFFALRMLLWMVLFMIMALLVLALVIMGVLWSPAEWEYLPMILFVSSTWGGSMGLALWLILVPFLLLGFRSSVYGPRVRNMLHPAGAPGEVKE